MGHRARLDGNALREHFEFEAAVAAEDGLRDVWVPVMSNRSLRTVVVSSDPLLTLLYFA